MVDEWRLGSGIAMTYALVRDDAATIGTGRGAYYLHCLCTYSPNDDQHSNDGAASCLPSLFSMF